MTTATCVRAEEALETQRPSWQTRGLQRLGRPTVADYKITYLDGREETVRAVVFTDNGIWIDFSDGGGQVLRIRSTDVYRIERQQG